MGRFVNSPTAIAVTENINPIPSRFSNRCLYSTPGTYTFTVPTGVDCITAVVVGPGGTQCEVVESIEVVTPTQGTVCMRICNLCPATVCDYEGLNPTCAHRTARELKVQAVSGMCFCFGGCLCQGYLRGAYGCTDNANGFGRPELKYNFVNIPSGAGGGFAEKAITTVQGCQYCVTVGAPCDDPYSRFCGYNADICSTGLKVKALESCTYTGFKNSATGICAGDIDSFLANATAVSCTNETDSQRCLTACFTEYSMKKTCYQIELGRGYGGNYNRCGGGVLCCYSASSGPSWQCVLVYAPCQCNGNPCYCWDNKDCLTYCCGSCKDVQILFRNVIFSECGSSNACEWLRSCGNSAYGFAGPNPVPQYGRVNDPDTGFGNCGCCLSGASWFVQKSQSFCQLFCAFHVFNALGDVCEFSSCAPGTYNFFAAIPLANCFTLCSMNCISQCAAGQCRLCDYLCWGYRWCEPCGVGFGTDTSIRISCLYTATATEQPNFGGSSAGSPFGNGKTATDDGNCYRLRSLSATDPNYQMLNCENLYFANQSNGQCLCTPSAFTVLCNYYSSWTVQGTGGEQWRMPYASWACHYWPPGGCCGCITSCLYGNGSWIGCTCNALDSQCCCRRLNTPRYYLDDGYFRTTCYRCCWYFLHNVDCGGCAVADGLDFGIACDADIISGTRTCNIPCASFSYECSPSRCIYCYYVANPDSKIAQDICFGSVNFGVNEWKCHDTLAYTAHKLLMGPGISPRESRIIESRLQNFVSGDIFTNNGGCCSATYYYNWKDIYCGYQGSGYCSYTQNGLGYLANYRPIRKSAWNYYGCRVDSYQGLYHTLLDGVAPDDIRGIYDCVCSCVSPHGVFGCIYHCTCQGRTDYNYNHTTAFCHCHCCSHTYYPICEGYNKLTYSGTAVTNNNPAISLYDVMCGKAVTICCIECCSFGNYCCATQACLLYPWRGMFDALKYDVGLTNLPAYLSAMYSDFTTSSDYESGCYTCVYKSLDKTQVSDCMYGISNVHSWLLNYNRPRHQSSCPCGERCGCLCCCYFEVSTIAPFDGRCASCLCQNKWTCNDSACSYTSCWCLACNCQGGAGIATAGTWGSNSSSCTLICTTGGCICEVEVLHQGNGMSQSPYLCVCCGTGTGAILHAWLKGSWVCGGQTCLGRQNANYISLCSGKVMGVDIVCGGNGFTTVPNICVQMDDTWCGTWFPCCCCSLSCCAAAACCCGMPRFCAKIAPQCDIYCCITTYESLGAGGGTCTGINNAPKCIDVVDSEVVKSVRPGRGGRGNEVEYEPYYFAYPGITARVSVPIAPCTYTGDISSGCSWFDVSQIKGSGGNGTFTSVYFACIPAQNPGPGGGGAVGCDGSGALLGTGGVLGGGSGYLGNGGLGGGAGKGGTGGNGMVVVYWGSTGQGCIVEYGGCCITPGTTPASSL